MSNPPNGYNTDVSYNKFKGSYFNDDIDVSGGDIISRSGNLYLAPNSSIFTESNQIQFNEEFQFTDFVNNVNVIGQLKNTYNSVEYDVGLQCEKVDTLVADVATLSPIVSDTQFKTTGFYWDSGLSSTVFNNNASFPNGSISSTAIDNTSFVTLSGAQTIDGIKTFNSAPVMSGASITTGTIPVNRVSGSAVNLSTAQTITATKTFSVVQNFTSNLRLDGSLLVGTSGGTTITNAQIQTIPTTALKTTNILYSSLTNQTQISNLLEFTGTLNGFSVANFNNAITQSLGLTSPAQSQLTTNANNITTANTNITALQGKLTNVSFTTPTTFITGTTESNVLKFNTSLNGITPTTLTYLSNVTSDIQQQINNVSSVSLSADNVFTGLCKFTNNLQLNSALVIKTPSTSVTLSNDNLTRIQYLSSVGSDLNTSITNLNSSVSSLNTSVSTLNTKTTKMSYMSVGGINTTTFTDGLVSQTFSFTGAINNITPTTFGYISDLTSSAQTQISNLATKLTGLTFSGTTTTVSNTLASSTLTFSSTLNNISTTTFAFLSGASENLQTAISNLKTKTDTTNVNVATLTTTVNDFALRTTEMSYSDDPTPQTNITNKIVLEEVVFTTDLNDITPTTFGYLAGVSSNIQTQLNTKIDSIVGTIIQHIKDDLQTNYPTRFLLCNGQAVSRTGTYANLFAMIGVTYGSGDGSTFNVPDFTACFLRGAGSARTFGGVVYTPPLVGTIQQDSMEAHVHSTGLSGISYLRTGTTTASGYFPGTIKPTQSAFPDFGGAVSSSHRTTTETRPLNHSVYFYITC